MAETVRALNSWRMRRFMASLPPVARDEDWIRSVFRRDNGREFNPWRAGDRDTVRCGVRRAMIRALPVLFGGGR